MNGIKLPPNDRRLRYYKQLEGATITKVELSVYDAEYHSWPVLHVKLADGTEVRIIVQCDEEGNGPGHLDGLTWPS